MKVKEVPSVYSDETILEISCKYCGAKLYVNETILSLWKSQGTILKCECGIEQVI